MKSWYVIKTKAKQEDLAAANLNLAGLEIFNPKIKHLENLFGSRVWVDRPLFPCYIFSRFDVFVNYRRVKYAGGVRDVVGFGEGPIPVDESIIRVISKRLDRNGFIEVERNFSAGDAVEIIKGPLQGLAGVLEGEISGVERVAILLNTIGFQARVLIESNLLQKSSIH